MFIATLAVIIFVVVLALVVRKQNIENQKRVKELVFLSACGNEEAKRALEKANLSPQEYSQLLETALREKGRKRKQRSGKTAGHSFLYRRRFQASLQMVQKSCRGRGSASYASACRR